MRVPRVGSPTGVLTAILAVGLLASAIAATHSAFSSTTSSAANAYAADGLLPATGLATAQPKVTLSWTPTASTWATGYRIMRATSPGGPYSQVADVAGRTTSSYTDRPTGQGVYYYTVNAYYGATTWTTASTETGVPVGFKYEVQTTPGLVSYWRLGESSGTSAADSWGSNTGTYTPGSPTFGTTGALLSDANTAVTLNGTSHYVVVPDAASLKPAQITLEAWVNPTGTGPTYGTVVMKATDSTWTDGYGLYWKNDNTIHFYVNNWSTNDISAAITANQWTHVVGTYDGTTMRLYKNGAQVASTPYSTAIAHTAQPLWIGRGAGGAYYWKGALDDIALYNTALTATQVSNHYAYNVCNQAPVTLTTTGDAFVKADKVNENHDTEADLDLNSESGPKDTRIFVSFNIPAVQSGCVVTAASLTMTQGNSQGTRTLQAYRAAASWLDSTVTWANQPATAGSPATTTNAVGLRTWDVTSQVSAMYSNNALYGFVIKDSVEGNSPKQTQKFDSLNKGGGANAPKLTITYGPG